MSGKNEKIDIGLDAGSVSLNTVLIDEGGKILEDHYTRMKGQPVRTALRVLSKVLKRYPQERIDRVAVTGSGGKLIAELIGAEFINEIVAQARAVEHLYPQVRTVIDIGGEDSKLIILNSGSSGKLIIEDFSMNTICAAGTGSFLDQQATRLGLSIEEEFGNLALKSKNPPRIAGRCSVFAKTDMIHLQQEAAPDYDIVAGLCYALARNFKSSIGRGKRFERPIIFQGGVAANKGMVKAFRDVLEVDEEELIIPKHYASMGAIGASLILREKSKEKDFRGLEGLEEYLKTCKDTHKGLAPLSPGTHCPSSVREQSLTRDYACPPVFWRVPPTMDCYLGIDVGSISTNVVAIDEEGKVIARRYLMTAGRPLEAVRRGIKEIGEEMGSHLQVRGVGTTGSGRYLIGDFIGADIVKNEITAQATAAAAIDPAVDTIFEIGGQDSKYIGLEGGVVVDFEMNKVCAAGTGSFLEEQAERLEINIKEEFGNLALQAPGPVRLGERCTVFMETNLVSHQQKGAGKEDLVAGLSYSIVENYLNRVVGDKKIGNNIFFQGAVALNRGVVAAFEKVLGKRITVPPDNDVTGAIGVALCAREWKKADGRKGSKFKGFENIAKAKYELRSFECPDCPNHCQIREVKVKNESSLFYGSRCEKYNVDKEKKNEDIPDLFAEREKLLLASYSKPSTLSSPPSAKIGIPRALTSHELYPLWQAFFTELGFEVVLSERTNKRTIRQGLESVVAETCFPIKVAHGHVLNLVKKKVDYIFLPILINMKQSNPGLKQSFACPYVQTLPHFIRSALDLEGKGIKIVDPVLAFGWGGKLIKPSLKALAKSLGKKGREAERAIQVAEEAQESFYQALQARGREVLNSLDEKRPAVVIVSRPYNGCDAGINLNLPKKLRDLGALPIPMDYLPLDEIDLSADFPDMYWRYGQKILSAAEIIRKDKRLQALYITNFGCGPDSFIARFFRERMSNKPYLQIEIDEHSADVGAITRCEAFLDSLNNVEVEEVKEKKALELKREKAPLFSKESRRTVYIPWMGDHAFVVKAALESHGVPAEVFPQSDAETLKWGRKFTSGKECYPCILTTGDMVKIVKSPGFDPQKAAFFMPTANGPCRFGQYHKLQRMILDELGCQDVPIISPNQGNKNMYKDLGLQGRSFVRIWEGMIVVDLLDKMAREHRPYEINKGETEGIYQSCLNKVCQELRGKGSLARALKKAGETFGKIKTRGEGEKPKIGIVGEIFVRNNKFSNDYLVNQVEGLGGEVWMPPFAEWLFHINGVLKLYNWLMRDYRSCLGISIRDKFQQFSEKRLTRLVAEALRDGEEPGLKEIWRNAKPYLPSWFGEAALSLGKSVDYAKKGLAGIINVMPFTCLPGTITTAVLKRFREDYNGIPCLTIAYDGLEQTNAATRLEAFIYQANQYRRSRA